MWITQLVPLNIKKKKKKKKRGGGRRRRIPFFLPYLMLLFFITILPFFLLFSNSFPLHTLLPSRACEIKLLSIFFWQQVLYLLAHLSNNLRKVSSRIVTFSLEMSLSFKRKCTTKMDNVDDCPAISVLDLPDLALDCILGKLKPIELCKMAGVCSSLRERCRSDYLWERHMREKWGRVVGRVAKREREWYLAMRKEVGAGGARAELGRKRKRKRWSIGSLVSVWPLSWLKSRLDIYSKTNSMLLPLDESIMSWYLTLENGKFWFPAQVYNREHGHVGFMLSCYDADLSYNFRTDSFQARYPPHGRTVVVEEGVEWERIRPPPIDTPAYDLHASDCLHDLHPGNHIEIQWRRNKEFPYGWWYGIVGHLESCDGSVHFCRCHKSDTMVLEFNQYTPGSRWGRTTISRKSHREQGSEADGLYGGIRKLYTMDEISTWKQLWPVEVLE